MRRCPPVGRSPGWILRGQACAPPSPLLADVAACRHPRGGRRFTGLHLRRDVHCCGVCALRVHPGTSGRLPGRTVGDRILLRVCPTLAGCSTDSTGSSHGRDGIVNQSRCSLSTWMVSRASTTDMATAPVMMQSAVWQVSFDPNCARATSVRDGAETSSPFWPRPRPGSRRWRSPDRRIRALIPQRSTPLPLSVSVGVATLDPYTDGENVDSATLMRAADAAMYEAKRSGRDRVVGASPTKSGGGL